MHGPVMEGDDASSLGNRLGTADGHSGDRGGSRVDATTVEKPEVDGAVQVTANPTPFRAHATLVVAVHPEDPAIVVGVAVGDARSGRCSLHVSTNAALSWGEATSPQPADWPICVRNTPEKIAHLAFDSKGTVSYAFAGWKPDDWHSRIFQARSPDAPGRRRSFPEAKPPYAFRRLRLQRPAVGRARPQPAGQGASM